MDLISEANNTAEIFLCPFKKSDLGLVFILKTKTKEVFKGGLKSSYDDDIFAVDDFFDQWDTSTVTQMKEVCELQEELC